MKFNQTSVKVILAFVVAIVGIFWSVNSIRSQSYSGADLNFSVGGGPVSITNVSEQPAPVQFVSTGSRAFRVTSTIEDVSGNSTRDGTGSSRINVFEFELPSGTNEFTISNGRGVNFVSDSDALLEATVVPMSIDTRNTTMIIAAIVALGALFYASNTTKHHWVNIILKRDVVTQIAPTASSETAQGEAAKSYGDNRS